MAKVKSKKRLTRETQALLRAEMAQPRKAHSVQMKEDQLLKAKASGARAKSKKKNAGMRGRPRAA